MALTSAKLKEDLLGIVDGDGDGKISIDWQRAYINDVKLIVKSIDNTGAKPNERINVIENQFTRSGPAAGQVLRYAGDCPQHL